MKLCPKTTWSWIFKGSFRFFPSGSIKTTTTPSRPCSGVSLVRRGLGVLLKRCTCGVGNHGDCAAGCYEEQQCAVADLADADLAGFFSCSLYPNTRVCGAYDMVPMVPCPPLMDRLPQNAYSKKGEDLNGAGPEGVRVPNPDQRPHRKKCLFVCFSGAEWTRQELLPEDFLPEERFQRRTEPSRHEREHAAVSGVTSSTKSGPRTKQKPEKLSLRFHQDEKF